MLLRSVVMLLFVKVVKKEESFDLGKNFDRSSVCEEDGCQPPLRVWSLVDLAYILKRYPTLVSNHGGPTLVNEKR